MLRPSVRIFARSQSIREEGYGDGRHVLILLSANTDLALHLAPAHVILDRPAVAPSLVVPSSTSKTNVELLQLHLRLSAPGPWQMPADGTSCMVTEVAGYVSNESLGPDVLSVSSRVPRRRLGPLSGMDQWQGRRARWRGMCALSSFSRTPEFVPNVDVRMRGQLLGALEIRAVSSFSS
ncbi:hypothetical protein EDB89DRAFT_2005715 [Lactarius sanguifluus]|nr:hypothetical protein EDB89DRAFT_2005715 [Lactarius sanguifluus]